MGKAICVYCSSSDGIGQVYAEGARELGRLIGSGGHSLVYGGGRVGLMGIVAEAARAAGAEVTGIIPEALVARGIAGTQVDRLVVTRDMRERKAAMQERSDAFVALPGGFGTLDELLEIMTLRQLGYHDKAVAVVNTDGFFDPLFAQIERMYALGFAKAGFRALSRLVPSPGEALSYVEGYLPVPLPPKWTHL